MPRVTIKKKDYKLSDLSAYIAGKMYAMQIRQADMAGELNISQPAFCKRLAKGLFTYEEMLTILKRVEATDDEILKLMKM